MEIKKRVEKFEAFKKELFNKCWEDEAFKQRLVMKPNETLTELGVSTTREDVKFVVNDQSDYHTVYINIPASPDISKLDAELTTEELEFVAGGVVDGDSYGICLDINIGDIWVKVKGLF